LIVRQFDHRPEQIHPLLSGVPASVRYQAERVTFGALHLDLLFSRTVRQRHLTTASTLTLGWSLSLALAPDRREHHACQKTEKHDRD
jgi:hypothetical protein